MEFLRLLLEPTCVFWRKVPMCTLIILGNRQQATVVYGQAKKHLHPPPKKTSFVCSEPTQLCFKFPTTKSGDTLLSLYAKLHALRCFWHLWNCMLLITRNRHIVNDWTASRDKWAWLTVKPYESALWTFAWMQTRTLWHFHVQRYSITKMTHILFKKLSQALIYLSM